MIDNNSFLNRLNPVTKLILMTIATIIVTFAYDIYIPIMFLFLILILGAILGQINIGIILKKLMKFIFVGISLSIFIIVTRALTKEGLTIEIITTAISLCLRIIVFSLTSIIFVLTTDPNEFALSLIHQLRIPYKAVYPFLIAYRFVPTFQSELEKIVLAKEVRGVGKDKGFLAKIFNFPKYIMPLLTSAVRKGERISISMESRGFGVYDDRTYYTNTRMGKEDYAALLSFVLISILIVFIGIKFNLVDFKIGLVIK